MRKYLIKTVLPGALLLAGANIVHAGSIEGTWQRPLSDGGTLMKITKCGSDYCVWVASGKHKGRKTGALTPSSDGVYRGSLTDLRDDKVYTGKAVVAKNGQQVKVSGCVLKIICLGETWSRY